MRLFIGTGERAVNVLVAVLLVASLAGPFVGGAAAVPSGMVTIPDANVSEDVPVGSNAPINATRLEGNVMASEHAETLRVIVTTPDRAEDYLENGSAAGSSDSLTLVLKDDSHSQGRRVAIGAEAVRDALGYTPDRVYGTHEDGSKWSRAVDYDAGMLVFEVPHFSTNSITFSGEVSVTGTYTDGSTVNYNVSSLDSVSNFSINMTGSKSEEWDNTTKYGVGQGTVTVDPDLAGNIEPIGPDGGEPKVAITGRSRNFDAPGPVNRDVDQWEWRTDGSYTYVDRVRITLAEDGFSSGGATTDYEIYGVSSGTVYATGTASLTDTGSDNYDHEDHYKNLDTTVNERIGVRLLSSPSDVEAYGGVKSGPPQDVSVSAAGTTDSLGSLSNSVRKRYDLQTGDTIDVSHDIGHVDVIVWAKERSVTTSPSVTVNGHTSAYQGTLSDGETASLSTNDSWIESTNTVDISVGNGSLSSDAPPAALALNYTHEASDKQSVNFSGNKWSESYNVSKTFASDRASASLTVPFEDEVASIHSIETRVNGGSWSSVSQSNYHLNETTLTVDLGSVNGGDTVEVRTTGRRVNVIDGSITVTEPTVRGDRLDTKVRLDSWSQDSRISVGVTPDARRVHYAYKESWSNADPYSKITADGLNLIYFPAASAGGEARISTIPVSVNPANGDVRITVNNPRTQEPQFSVRPSDRDGDTVEYTFIESADSTHYVLKSKTNDVVHDDGTASGSLTLEDDDSAETLVFLKDPVSSDSGPVGPVDVGGGSGDPLSSPAVVVIAWGLLTAGFYVLQRRVGGPSGVRIPFVGGVPFPGGLITAVGSIGSCLLIIEFYSGRVSTALASVIESVGPIAGIAAIGIVVWWAYNQFRGRPVVIDQ